MTRADKSPKTVHAPAAGKAHETVQGVSLSHPDRELWPGITKRELAQYWLAVAEHALPEIAHRPLAMVRCPEGIAGEHFFQKHAHHGFPAQIRSGEAGGAPFLAIDDAAGLVAAAQVGAIELHAWGATEADPLHPDRLVIDLDPGEGVGFAEVVAAAQDVRERLAAAGLAGFCRTSGGKGLHVVAPLVAKAGWPEAREWSHGLARAMAADSPDRYVAAVPKQQRQGHILVDWLRNGLGATAVATFSPRARPGAGVATPLAWREVTAALDPAAFTLDTVPARLQRQRADPWSDFASAARPLPAEGAG
jgi:bifunctional non-homologous end joining protein LigD